MAWKSLLMDGTVHERTLLGMTNEEGFPLGRGMPTGLGGSPLDGVCRSHRRDKRRYSFLVVTGCFVMSVASVHGVTSRHKETRYCM